MNFDFLRQQLGPLPVWAWAGIAIGGGLIVAWVIKRKGSSSSSSGTTLGNSASGIPNDPNIDPLTGVPYAIEEAINPNTGLPNYYNQDNSGGGGGPQGQPAKIRARDLTGPFSYWDKTHPQGIPIRPQPGSTQIVGYDAYGSSVTISGGPVSQQYNNQGQLLNWYQVPGGWVQSVDLVLPNGQPPNTSNPSNKTPNNNNGGGGGGQGGAMPYQATPYWPQMTDLAAARYGRGG